MRATFNTSLSFGLVNVPVKAYTATESHDIKFHQRHGGAGGCGGSVGKRDVCKQCEQTVAYADIAKGIERDERVVTFTREELAAIERDSDRVIDVLQFVHAEQINPLTLEAPYYLEPTKESLEGYVLLREVLTESDRVGVVRYTHRGVTHLAALRVIGKVITLQNVIWADELRVPDFAILEKNVTLNQNALKMAHRVVESMMADDFDPAAHTDTYRERVAVAIEARFSNAELPTPAEEKAAEADVSDLLAALEASIQKKARSRKGR